MRGIKFRAWNKELNSDGGMIWNVAVLNGKYFDVYKMETEEYPLMQYTGINDKNGVEIYEGDILFNKSIICQPDGKLTTKIIGDIQTLNGMTYLIGKTWQDVDGEDIRVSEYKSLMLNPELFKIIGNIYENPEIRDNN